MAEEWSAQNLAHAWFAWPDSWCLPSGLQQPYPFQTLQVCQWEKNCYYPYIYGIGGGVAPGTGGTNKLANSGIVLAVAH